MQIRGIKETECLISKRIKCRDETEKEVFSEIIKGYQALIKRLKDNRGTTDNLRQSLMSNLAPGLENTGAGAEKIHELNDDLRKAYKKLSIANETIVRLEKENENLSKKNKILEPENQSMKIVLADLKEKVEIRTKEFNAMRAENELLDSKIRELNQDNALYFKKIIDLQKEVVEKMNDANQLYEEASKIRQDSILQKNDELGFSDSSKPGLDLTSMISEGYFKIPSKIRHNLFAHSKEAMCLNYSCQGTNIATGGGDGTIKIWDVEQGKEYGSLARQKKAITCLKFSPDDQLLAT